MARFPMTATEWDNWVRTSLDGFPQAKLDLPASAANGFYQCSKTAPQTCDLLIQLRAGVHVEVRGDGTAGRSDVDAIARGLHLAGLATPSG
jgi:hypothetical protein